MPINVYTGLMGSGKSFECVRSVILPAIQKGRRVVTNVDGIDSDAIRAYLNEKNGIPSDKLGHVVHCTNDQVLNPNFFPFGENVDTFCQPGDLICLDEAWRFFGTDKKLLDNHKIFFREHRHYVHPVTHVSCDLVLMVQDISDLHRVLKVVVEMTFRTTKLKSLGLNKAYRVEWWEGYRTLARNRAGVENKTYDPQIFPLYSSYSGGKGKEVQVDGRQNLMTKNILFIAIGTLVMLGLGIKFSLHYFDPDRLKKDDQSEVVEDDLPSTSAPKTSQPSGIQPVAPSSALPGQTDPASWRISGFFRNGDELLVVLTNGVELRLEHPSSSSLPERPFLSVFDDGRSKLSSWGPVP